MPDAILCLRCHTVMEPGFVADRTQGGYVQEKWSSGAPQTSFWQGLKIDDNQALAISTFRCPTCGYLESYAR